MRRTGSIINMLTFDRQSSGQIGKRLMGRMVKTEIRYKTYNEPSDTIVELIKASDSEEITLLALGTDSTLSTWLSVLASGLDLQIRRCLCGPTSLCDSHTLRCPSDGKGQPPPNEGLRVLKKELRRPPQKEVGDGIMRYTDCWKSSC